MASLGGCLIDFHAAALGADRAASENRTIEEAVSEDIVEDLPGVAAGESLLAVFDPTPDRDPEPPYDQTDDERIQEILEAEDEDPLPGEHWEF
jgi:hypothetical protein